MAKSPERAQLIANLRTLQAWARGREDEDSLWVGTEIALGLTATLRAEAAQRRGDELQTMIYLRLLAEVALRVRWLAGDADEADAMGYPSVDATVVRERLRRLRRRDYDHVVSALKVSAEYAGKDAGALVAKLEAKASKLGAESAPRTWRGLATSRSGGSAYAAHKMCSNLVHASSLMAFALRKPNPRLPQMIDDCAHLITAWGAPMLEALAEPGTTGSPPSG